MANWHRINQEKRMIQNSNKGYHLRAEKPWHWEITVFQKDTLVHVWPTTQKCMVAFDHESSRYLNGHDLLGFLERAFNPPAPVARDVASGTKEARDLFNL